MAEAITTIAQNYLGDKNAFDGLDSSETVGTWRINIPYSTYMNE